jgi:hypothetical protein
MPTSGLSERSSISMYRFKLNLTDCFKGYLFRPMNKLKLCRFRSTSYSPVAELMAGHKTEAEMETSFSEQLNSLVG